jgi:hypothetical protein
MTIVTGALAGTQLVRDGVVVASAILVVRAREAIIWDVTVAVASPLVVRATLSVACTVFVVRARGTIIRDVALAIASPLVVLATLSSLSGVACTVDGVRTRGAETSGLVAHAVLGPFVFRAAFVVRPRPHG